MSAPGLLGVFALCLTIGSLLGIVLGTYLELTLRVRRPLNFVCDVGVAFGVAAFLFDELGIIAKWQGPTLAMAQLAALGAIGLGYALGLMLALVRAVLRAPEHRRWLRPVLALLSILVVLALSHIARSYSFPQYPSLDKVFRLAELVFGGLGLIALFAAPPLTWLSPRVCLPVVACASVAASPLLSGRTDLHVLLSDATARSLLVSMRGLTDFDRDGYSAWFGGADCSAFDPAVHPLARDVPGDGIDQDCRGGDRKVTHEPMPSTTTPKGAGERPSIVLITIDALRADRMSLFGAARDTTPFLEQWAQSATRFSNTYTSGGWTSLALPSLLRGLHPRRLAWTHVYETDTLRLLRAHAPIPAGERIRMGFAMPLKDPHPPLNELLRTAGYATAAVVDDGVTAYFSKELGAFPGFDDYHEIEGGPVDRTTSNTALRWLEHAPADRPFFLWTHYFGPHGPSSRHPGLRNYGTQPIDEYDTEIAHLDRELARLLARLDELARERSLAVFITSDHGEDFNGYDRVHGVSLLEWAIRVPMIVRLPGLAPGLRPETTSVLDVMPTALGLAQVKLPGKLDGFDLRAPLPTARNVRFETWRLDRHGKLVLDLAGASDGTHKVTLDTLLLDAAAFMVANGKEQEVPFSPRHEALLGALYDALSEDGPPQFSD
jgi:hypothetical protein